ncbi:hypothetical protein GXP70_12725 [Paenibacillus lycopersici]|uniref:Uncharacterized protein n=1 Tax=Paenibacillus lycopersici TaxID=2704462 RepID=A0A6C0FZS6_9BACL|nr:hypothetical protein [Paenibacillus lycopersici]QHT60724.1 hypothetical protein GXP70_12725 [Paenibacillus lycopersici]
MEPWQTIMLVGGIVVVSAVMLPKRAGKESPANDSQTVRNMETALEQFMENMEADSREIAGLVSKSNEESQAQAAKRDDRVGQLERRIAELEQTLAEQAAWAANAAAATGVSSEFGVRFDRSASPFVPQPSVQSAERPADASEVLEPAEAAEETAPPAPSIRSRYAELFELHQAGKSIEAIAKKLGLNKGEVQLILQLSRQEEASRG